MRFCLPFIPLYRPNKQVSQDPVIDLRPSTPTRAVKEREREGWREDGLREKDGERKDGIDDEQKREKGKSNREISYV